MIRAMVVFALLAFLLALCAGQQTQECGAQRDAASCLAAQGVSPLAPLLGGMGVSVTASCAWCDGLGCDNALMSKYKQATGLATTCSFPERPAYLFAYPSPSSSSSLSLRTGATTCESLKSSETKCMSSSEGGVPCAYCTSGAVGASCMVETDAKGLPSSVFVCEFQTPAVQASTTCESAKSSQSKCLATKENGEQCAYCTSGAVGASCMVETDAKGLPSSVFTCVYAN